MCSRNFLSTIEILGYMIVYIYQLISFCRKKDLEESKTVKMGFCLNEVYNVAKKTIKSFSLFFGDKQIHICKVYEYLKIIVWLMIVGVHGKGSISVHVHVLISFIT